MRKPIISGAVVILFAVIASFAAERARIRITSSAFQEGGNIPSKSTCDGSDTSPPLQITGIPSEAKSLVLIADDPDGSGTSRHRPIQFRKALRQKACTAQMILANQITRVRVRRQACIGIRSRFSLSIANWICAVVQSAANSMPR